MMTDVRNRGIRPWFAIALVLDFTMPKTQELLKHSYEHFKNVTVISYGAKPEDSDPSSCGHARMQTVPAKELKSWASKMSPATGSPRAFAESVRKLKFELQFNLRNIENVIIVSDGTDTCGQDACQAFKELDQIATKGRKKVRVQLIGSMKCDTSQWKSLKFANSTEKPTKAVVKTAEKPIPGQATAVADNEEEDETDGTAAELAKPAKLEKEKAAKLAKLAKAAKPEKAGKPGKLGKLAEAEKAGNPAFSKNPGLDPLAPFDPRAAETAAPDPVRKAKLAKLAKLEAELKAEQKKNPKSKATKVAQEKYDALEKEIEADAEAEAKKEEALASVTPGPKPSGSPLPDGPQVLSKKDEALATTDLVIMDTPAEVRFDAIRTDIEAIPGEGPAKKEWGASELVTLATGKWKINVINYSGVFATIEMKPNERKELRYYRDFPLKPARVHIEGPPVGFRFEPSNFQNQGKPLHAKGGDKLTLPAGNWKISFEFPTWASGVPALPWLGDPSSDTDISVMEEWASEIDWVKPDGKGENLLVIGEESAAKRVLVPANSPPIPVPKTTSWKLIVLHAAR